jgi:hypothetical protein
MSHQPGSRKRTIDLVTPEFPLLLSATFAETLEFAGKSQEALRSVPAISTILPSLFLPLISPNSLHYSFKVMESSVFVVIRKSYFLLKNDVESLNSDYCGIYVQGPVGVGKSYLLYLLAAEYRLNRQSYRVTYINNCGNWRNAQCPYLHLLKELVVSFYDDVINGRSMKNYCETLDCAEKKKYKAILNNLLDSIVDYVYQSNLTWIVIFDQHNGLFNPLVIDDSPFNLIHLLSNERSSNIKVVIAASANNEGYPYKKEGWFIHNISSHRFNQEEFKVWCDHYLLEDHTRINYESEEAVNAFFWTGGIPNELALLWEQPKKSLIEKTLLYRKNRVEEMAESHGTFCDNLSDIQKKHLQECISRMSLGLSAPEILDVMDRELLHIIEDEDGHEIITALNPVARCALLNYHGFGPVE